MTRGRFGRIVKHIWAISTPKFILFPLVFYLAIASRFLTLSSSHFTILSGRSEKGESGRKWEILFILTQIVTQYAYQLTHAIPGIPPFLVWEQMRVDFFLHFLLLIRHLNDICSAVPNKVHVALSRDTRERYFRDHKSPKHSQCGRKAMGFFHFFTSIISFLIILSSIIDRSSFISSHSIDLISSISADLATAGREWMSSRVCSQNGTLSLSRCAGNRCVIVSFSFTSRYRLLVF